jgi:N6-L-threonylcarbamoyladenine synthase
MIVLGIETSCDETAAAIVNDRREILASRVQSQVALHAPYGGIVPEIAARSHLDHLGGLILQAFEEARAAPGDLDGVAATAGPGLIGGLLVGLMTAKAMAAALNRPFIAVNHLEGHVLSVRLSHAVEFPYLILLVSGGHSQLLIAERIGRYRRLGTTIDDAAGEAFDKTAKLLGLAYPGGPEIERRASAGDPARFELPRPLKGTAGCHFSFSGLKTAVRRTVEHLGRPFADKDVADLAAAFQFAVGDVLVERSANAMAEFRRLYGTGRAFVIVGGVAANRYLRGRLEQLCAREGFMPVAPPPSLCTDNAAMIAWAGIEHLQAGLADRLDFAARPRWPLDPDAPKALGAGIKA